MLRLERVAQSDLANWGAFTYPYYRPRLLAADPDLIGVAASIGGHPAGFAVASIREDDRRIADVCSVTVGLAHRRRGIATALLQRMEEEAGISGCGALVCKYMTNRPATAAVEALLRKSGWSPGEQRMLFCESDFATITQAPWMAQRDFPAGYEPFLWATLTSAEREDILDRQRRDPWFPETLTPFWMEDTIEPVSSLGLRYHGEIAGWCVSHRVRSDTIRYSRLFVRRELQGLARAVPLLARSIYCHEHTEVDKAIFDVAAQNTLMLRFVERRMKPYLKSMYWSLQSTKIFADPRVSAPKDEPERETLIDGGRL
jgi:GNAT superfamily N-acetyltransferase